MTSTSIVGLPRESRISRARTLSMTALVVKLMGSFSSADAGDRATDKPPAVPSDRLSAVGYCDAVSMKTNPRPERQQRLLTPRQIFTYLDRYVVGQERAKRTIAIAA